VGPNSELLSLPQAGAFGAFSLQKNAQAKAWH